MAVQKLDAKANHEKEVRADGFSRIREDTGKKRAEKRDLEEVVEEEAHNLKKDLEKEAVVLKQQNIKAGFKVSDAVVADLAIADFFYANAISASSETDSLHRKMVKAIQNAPMGYVPPGAKRLGGDLFNYDGMWKKMKERDPEGESHSCRPAT